MGGGDLNTKKSWHPNTMKNQERVWKAEQAAAEEKKKILELQRERELEHDRSQLNEMAQRNFGASGPGGDNKLHWMYDKPNKQAQHEDYLLGKALGKNDESEQQQNSIPAVNRRVIGSSMLSSTDDSQVDLARKMREDPLLLVKERERAARAALLNNPLQRKRIAELLRKEQEQKESSTKKKSKKKEKDLDNLLASKLNALGTDKGINLASLLNSDSSSSDSSSDEQPKKKKRKKDKQKKKKKKKSKDSDTSDKDDKRHRDKSHSKKTKSTDKSSRYDNDFDIPSRKELESIKKKQDSNKEISKRNKESKKRRSSENEKHDRADKKRKKKHNESDTDGEIDDKKRDANKNRKETTNRGKESRKRHSSEIERDDRADKKKKKKHYESDTDSEIDHKKRDTDINSKRTGFESRKNDQERRRATSPVPAKWQERERKEKRKGLSSEERAARLAEMAAAGAEHEAERGRRVARQRAADSAADLTQRSGAFRNEARALPDSLESRIHSNRHYIQRDKTHMDKHFARR